MPNLMRQEAQLLRFEDQPFLNTKKKSFEGNEKNHLLSLKEMPETISLKFKTLCGKNFSLSNIAITTTIGTVKDLLQESQSFAKAEQKLIHMGKILQDNQTLTEAKLTNNSFLVCMVSKVRKSESAPTNLTEPFDNANASIEYLRGHPDIEGLRYRFQNGERIGLILDAFQAWDQDSVHFIRNCQEDFLDMLREPLSSEVVLEEPFNDNLPTGTSHDLLSQFLGLSQEEVTNLLPGFIAEPADVLVNNAEPSPTDLEAVNRIAALGFTHIDALRAYLEWDKDENAAADSLFELTTFVLP